MERSEVYKLIDGERAYQQAQGKPDNRPLYEWVGSIHYYTHDATQYTHVESDRDETIALHELRKIAALAVAALEQYGCEPRTVGEGEAQ